MNITIVGTGYVGLVTGTTLAELGNNVFCVDIDEKKVEGMRNGIVPIYEPNLEEMFLRNIQAQRLFFTTDLKEALDKSEVIYLALPTPPGEDGSADLSYVLKVASDIGEMMTEYKVSINPLFPWEPQTKFAKRFPQKRRFLSTSFPTRNFSAKVLPLKTR